MHSQLNGKEIFLQAVHDNIICSFFSLKYLFTNYSGPINTAFPVDCLIYTVKPLDTQIWITLPKLLSELNVLV